MVLLSKASAQLFPDNTFSSFTTFYELLTGATKSEVSKIGCNFGNILPVFVPKCHRMKIQDLWRKISKVGRVYLLFINAPENADIFSSRKSFNTAAKSVGRHFLRKHLSNGSSKRKAPINGNYRRKKARDVKQENRVITTKSANQTNQSCRDTF